MKGPCIILEKISTILVLKGWKAKINELSCLILTKVDSKKK